MPDDALEVSTARAAVAADEHLVVADARHTVTAIGVDDAASRVATAAARAARRQADIDARASISPPGRAPDRFRVATWNLNSLRPRLPGLDRFLERTRPDVLCLQETKAARITTEAAAVFDGHGYHVEHVGSGGYNGVAIAATMPLVDVVCSGALGEEVLDREPRIASCLLETPEPRRVVSVYAPHGRSTDHWHFRYKLAFFAALTRRIRQWISGGTGIVVAGDVNVAATDSDVFHPDAFVGSVYVVPPARAALGGLLDADLVDVDVVRWGARARRFTWWDLGRGYSANLGMRLDLIATDAALAARLDTTWIDHVGRSEERPSDHAALVADFRLPPAAWLSGSMAG